MVLAFPHYRYTTFHPKNPRPLLVPGAPTAEPSAPSTPLGPRVVAPGTWELRGDLRKGNHWTWMLVSMLV